MHNSLGQSKVDTAVVEINLNTITDELQNSMMKALYLIIATCSIHLLKIYLGIRSESRLRKLIYNKNRATVLTSLLICPDIYRY